MSGTVKRTKRYPVKASVVMRRTKRDRFSKWCKAQGVIQADYLGRIIDWIMELEDDSIRSVFMQTIDESDRKALAIQILERIAGKEGQAGGDATGGGPALSPRAAKKEAELRTKHPRGSQRKRSSKKTPPEEGAA